MRRVDFAQILSVDPLSKFLQQASFALGKHDETEIQNWFRLELAGYLSSNKAMSDATRVPEYRVVVGQHVDEFGRVLQMASGLGFVNEFHLRQGVEELEEWARTRHTIRLQDPLSADLIRQYFNIHISYFQFSATSLAGVFSAVRTEAAERLAQVAPAHNSAASKQDRDEVIKLEPNFYGVGINLRALWRLCCRRGR